LGLFIEFKGLKKLIEILEKLFYLTPSIKYLAKV